MKTETKTQAIKAIVPAWYNRFRTAYQNAEAHVFNLRGGVRDYVNASRQRPAQFIAATLGTKFTPQGEVTGNGPRKLVAYLTLNGFRFPGGIEHEKEFRARMAPSQPKPQPGNMAGNLATAIKQAQTGGAPGELPREPLAALRACDTVMRSFIPAAYGKDESPMFTGLALIVDFCEMIFVDNPAAMMQQPDRNVNTIARDWAQDQDSGIGDVNVVFLVGEPITANLRDAEARIEALNVAPPDEDDRRRFIDSLLEEIDPDDDQGVAKRYRLDGLTPAALAGLTAGLPLLGVEDIFVRAANEGQGVNRVLAGQRKRELMDNAFDGILQISDPEYGFDSIAGMEYYKDWARKKLIAPLRDGIGQAPSGFLLVGPPGCGKTFVMTATAFEAAVPFVEFDFGALRGKFVGESEARTARVLAAIVALGKALVFIDEADQGGGRDTGNSGDSGVGARIWKQIATVMTDPKLKGQIVWAGATNRPDLVDAAMKRTGRMGDAIIAVLPPDADDRAAMFRAALPDLTPAQAAKAAEATDGYVSSDVANVCREAQQIRVESPKLTQAESLDEAIAVLLPSVADVEDQIAYALDGINNLSVLPPSYRDRAIQQKKRRATEAAPDQGEAGSKRRGKRAI